MASLDGPPRVSSDSTLAYFQQSQRGTPLPNPLDSRISAQSYRIPIPPIPEPEKSRWRPDKPPGFPDEPRRKPIPPLSGTSGFIGGVVSFVKSVVGAQTVAYGASENDKGKSPPRTDCEIGPSRAQDTSIASHVVPGSRLPQASALQPAGSSDVALSPWFEIHGGLEVEAERRLREMQEKEKRFPNNIG